VYEAESGALGGAARTDTCAACSGAAKVRFIGNGTANHDTITVNAESAGPAELTLTGTVSGTRSFFVSVNGGAAAEAPLTGTSWATPIHTSLRITLKAGANTVKIFNDTANAPDLDKITIG
jgi:hypothetical protein